MVEKTAVVYSVVRQKIKLVHMEDFKAAKWQFEGRPSLIEQEEAVACLRESNQFIWIRLIAPEGSSLEQLLLEQLQFPKLAVEAALSTVERPALHVFENEVSLEIPVVIRAAEAEIQFGTLSLFLGESWLVTLEYEILPQIQEWWARWLDRPAEVGHTPGHMLYNLVDQLVDDYFPALDNLEDQIDELEDQVHEGQNDVIARALQLKRQLLELRRRIVPIREVLNALLRRDVPVVSQECRVFLQDVYDHTLRLAETVDINRDILSGILDAHHAVVSNRLNQVMRVMTIMATLLMTPTLIAGIYGMNFKFMPELSSAWGYPFSIALMLAACGFELWLFKRKGWL